MIDMGQLSERLITHADMHAGVSPHDEEQAQWERDLRDAAAVISALAVACEGWAAPFSASRDEHGHANVIVDSTGRVLLHLNCGTVRNESEGGVGALLAMLGAASGR